MSLINQMLRDLEERRGDGVSSPVNEGAKPAASVGRSGLPWLQLAVIVPLLALLLGALLWWPSTPAPAPSAEAVAAATLSQPRIDSMEPARPQTRPGLQMLRLNGSGFDDGSRVLVNWGEGELMLPRERVALIGEGQLLARLRTGTEVNSWSIQVVNADGGRSSPHHFETLPPVTELVEAAPAPVAVAEDLPAPRIDSMQPEPIYTDRGLQSVTLIGEGFSKESRVLVSWRDQTRELGGYRTRLIDPQRLEVKLRLGSIPQRWSIQVLNGDTLASNVYRFMTVKGQVEVEGAPPSMASSEEPAGVEVNKRSRPYSAAQQAEQLYKEAYELLQMRRGVEAEAKLKQALELAPEHLAARETLAGLMIADGRHGDALMLLEEGLEKRPGEAVFAALAARMRLQEGDQSGALALLEQGMQAGANDAEYLALAAAVYQREGRFASSVNAYQRAISLKSNDPAWWLGLGISLEGAEQPEQALEAYRRVVDSRNIDAKLRRYAQGRVEVLRGARQ